MAKKSSTKWQNKHTMLEHQLIAHLLYLVSKKGKQSNFSTAKALPVKQDQMFALGDGCRWVVEITADKIIDDSGYEHSYSVLTLDQLCQIADNI